MSDHTCLDCKHYRRHYIKQGKNYYVLIADGHCVYPRLKLRKANTPACDRFSLRKNDT